MTLKQTEQGIPNGVPDLWFVRAAPDVFASYRIARASPQTDGSIIFDVDGGEEPYSVHVKGDWSAPPTSTYSCLDVGRCAKEHNTCSCTQIIAITELPSWVQRAGAPDVKKVQKGTKRARS